MRKLLLVALVLGAAAPLQAHLEAPVPAAPIPEKPHRIRPTKYFLKIKPAREFQVARPESFDDMSQFKTSDLYYSIDETLDEVWAKYLTINPLKIWSNKRAMIRAAYVPSLDTTLDREAMEQGWPGFEVGMKIFVDMSSLPWAISNRPAMMVALEIVRLDPVERIVVFRYLEGTPSYGEQVIRYTVSEDNPNVTEIKHSTWFRAYSRVIEAFYPAYHKKMIDGMHTRFKWEIEADAGP